MIIIMAEKQKKVLLVFLGAACWQTWGQVRPGCGSATQEGPQKYLVVYDVLFPRGQQEIPPLSLTAALPWKWRR